MSVVVYDGTWLAADRRAVCVGLGSTARKITRAKNGDLLAFTGIFEVGLILINWYNNGQNIEEWPEVQKTDEWTRLIVVTPKEVGFYERQPVKQVVQDSYIAWGSGRDYALGALAMGATAEQAVEATCKHCIDCGNGIDKLRIDECFPLELKIP